MTMRLPVHSPAAKTGLDSAFVARVLGHREAERLGKLFADAHRDARQKLDAAMREAADIMSRARAEIEADMAIARAQAEEILAVLPDFAALEAMPAKRGRTAYAVIRDVADCHGLAMAAVMGKGQDDRIKAVRREAIRAVAFACPRLTDAEIGSMFSGLPARTVHRYRRDDVG